MFNNRNSKPLIKDSRRSIVRCKCENQNEIKWRYKGQLYSVEIPHSSFMFNYSENVCAYNAEKQTVTIFAPTGEETLKVDIVTGGCTGMCAESTHADRVSYDFIADNRLYWYCRGKLYSQSVYEKSDIAVSDDGKYICIASPCGEAIWVSKTSETIAVLNTNKLMLCDKICENVIYAKLIPQYNLIAAFCDAQHSGYADEIILFDMSGDLLAQYSASEFKSDCFFCIETQLVSCPCIGVCRHKHESPIDYFYSTGGSITYNDCNIYWYDLIFSGGKLVYRFNPHMTEDLIYFNNVICR